MSDLPEWQVEMWLHAGTGFEDPDRMPDVTKRVRAASSTEASRLAVKQAREESPIPFRVVDVIVMRVADWKVRSA